MILTFKYFRLKIQHSHNNPCGKQNSTFIKKK